METGMQLLMKDGMVRLAFHPRLSVEQYGELLELVDKCGTKEGLRECLVEAIKRWGCRMEFEVIR